MYVDRTPKPIPSRPEPTLDLPGYGHGRRLTAIIDDSTSDNQPTDTSYDELFSSSLHPTTPQHTSDNTLPVVTSGKASMSDESLEAAKLRSTASHRSVGSDSASSGGDGAAATATTSAGDGGCIDSTVNTGSVTDDYGMDEDMDDYGLDDDRVQSAVEASDMVVQEDASETAVAEADEFTGSDDAHAVLVPESQLDTEVGSGGRSLLVQQEHLDGFRRNVFRQDCAEKVHDWLPKEADKVVDLVKYHEYVAGLDTVDIILWASQQLQKA